MQKLKAEQVTKEYLLLSQNENEFTKKKQLKHERALSMILPSWMLNLLGIRDEFFFRNNFNDQNMHFIRTRKIFPYSRESFLCRVTFIWQRQFTAFVE